MTEKEDEQFQFPEGSARARAEAFYPVLIKRIRILMGSGVIEADDPTEKQLTWAHGAALGNEALEPALATLARATEQAFKYRYLDGMPMLNDLDNSIDSDGDLNSLERFHTLRLFYNDFNEAEQTELSDEFPGLHPVFYPSSEDMGELQ